jgi:hypothetical protein
MARTIRKGGRIGKGYNYVVETGEVTYSNDPNIPVGSNVYKEGIRKDLRRPNQRPTDDDANRIRNIINDLIGVEDSEELMLEIMNALKDTVTPVPDVGKFYTFVYNAKTPNIRYDQHPLIACTEVYSTGFTGLNFHWGKYRKYTWNEVAGQLYIVDSGEIADLREIPYAKFLNS